MEKEIKEKLNLKLYDELRGVPAEAQKQFNNGRFSGTDINSMWRIKKLTEVFGICGIGWYTEILDMWIEVGKEDEKVANVKIALYIKNENEWSKPIIGIGGNKLATFENKKQAIYVSDECYKMAYTDAIGNACKMLGMGADIYWSEDRTKYSGENTETKITESQLNIIKEKLNEEQIEKALSMVKRDKLEDLTIQEASCLIKKIGGDK